MIDNTCEFHPPPDEPVACPEPEASHTPDAPAADVTDATAPADVLEPTSAAEPASAPETQSSSRRRKQKPTRPPAQVRASQENGKRGKGPVTAEGRRIARMNALKHGLCAGALLLPGDDAQEFAHRLAAWNADLDPQSDLESYLVTDIVAASWKIDRCRRVDALALTEQIHSATARFDDTLNRQHRDQTFELHLGHTRAFARLGRTTLGCRWLLERWQSLGQILQRQGRWNWEQTREALTLLGIDPARSAFSHPEARRTLAAAVSLLYPATRPTPEALAQACRAVRIDDARLPDRTTEAARLLADLPLPGAARRTLEDLAQRQQKWWTARLQVVTPLEAEARTIAVATAAVDLRRGGELRLRYEQAHRRAFHGALRELRTEQARRRSVEESSWTAENMHELMMDLGRRWYRDPAPGTDSADGVESIDQPMWSGVLGSRVDTESYGMQADTPMEEMLGVLQRCAASERDALPAVVQASATPPPSADKASPAPQASASAESSHVGAERTQGSPQVPASQSPPQKLSRKERKKLASAEHRRAREQERGGSLNAGLLNTAAWDQVQKQLSKGQSLPPTTPPPSPGA